MSPFTLSALRAKLARSSLPVDDGEDPPAAAVATILRDGADGAETLLIERAERAGDPWSGHVAFPGGKREPEDSSLLATSIRETKEEIGLRLLQSSLVARLEDVRARTNGYRVAQFVFTLDDPHAAVRTSPEVASTLWVPLAEIDRRAGEETFAWTVGGRAIELPCVRLGSLVLWGMTYRMISQVFAAAT